MFHTLSGHLTTQGTFIFTMVSRSFAILKNIFSCRFSGAHVHSFILDFLQSVAKRYQGSGRAKNFVLDLLAIRVPNLFAIERGEEAAGEEVQKNFKTFLQDFIRRNDLNHALLSDMNVIMVN